MEAFSNIVTAIDNWIWGLPMIVLLLGTHLFMTVRTGFIQRKTFTGIRLSVTKDPDSPGDVSQFQALTTALASTIGTGNIIGVGTAIFLGGPGAVFWCWLAGVFGIATKYAESLIAVKYRVRTPDGRMQGGAMYALERGLNMKWLGVLFAALAALASFGIGCGTQINAIAEVIESNSPIYIPPIAIGVVGGRLTGVVIIGGIQSIASVCEKLVPFMAAFYVLGCLIILCINYDFILPAAAGHPHAGVHPRRGRGRSGRRRPASPCVRRGARPVLQRVRHGLCAARGLPPRRPAIRCGRRWFPPPAPSGTRWWCA